MGGLSEAAVEGTIESQLGGNLSAGWVHEPPPQPLATYGKSAKPGVFDPVGANLLGDDPNGQWTNVRVIDQGSCRHASRFLLANIVNLRQNQVWDIEPIGTAKSAQPTLQRLLFDMQTKGFILPYSYSTSKTALPRVTILNGTNGVTPSGGLPGPNATNDVVLVDPAMRLGTDLPGASAAQPTATATPGPMASGQTPVRETEIGGRVLNYTLSAPGVISWQHIGNDTCAVSRWIATLCLLNAVTLTTDNALPAINTGASWLSSFASLCALALSPTVIGGIVCGAVALGAGVVTAGTSVVLYAEGRQDGTTVALNVTSLAVGGVGNLADAGAATAKVLADAAHTKAIGVLAKEVPWFGKPGRFAVRACLLTQM